MEASFYWFSWFLTILCVFFLHRQKLRNDLLWILGILMCTYDLFSMGDSQLYLHVILLLLLGTYLFVSKSRSLYDYFWPFIFSVGYASVWMFLIIHPVWTNFPGVSLFPFIIVAALRLFLRDIEGLLGLWMITNAGGSLFVFLTFAIYQNEGLIDSHVMLSMTVKGMLVLVILYGFDRLKKSIFKKRKTTAKGAAYV